MGVRYIKRTPPEKVALSIDETGQLAKQCDSYPVLIYSLLNRGYSKTEIEDLLTADIPGDKLITAPLRGAEKAANEIVEKLRFGESIGIFADYDCDGITSGYVMHEGLTQIKNAITSASNITVHYPQRKEGYGLNLAYCEKAVKNHIGMVITVDNGIATKEQCKFLKSNGIKPIVTDHHEPNKEFLPDCTIVDPCFNDLSRSYLAGVAVAFNVVNAIANIIGVKLDYDKLIPAVAIGTLSDCMPMSYENSCYVKRGLDIINDSSKTSCEFLRLMKDTEVLTTKDVSFSIAPKINAASRMGDTRLGAAGFFYHDEDKVNKVIEKLDELNQERKKVTEKARDVVSKIDVPEENRIILFNGAEYGKGVHGIIASEITKLYPNYPAFVYSERILPESKTVICGGSIRCANEAINAIEMFDQLKAMNIVSMVAGHSSACVIEIEKDKLDEFVQMFNKLFDSLEVPPVTVALDGQISMKEASNSDLLRKLNAIPFTVQEAPLFGINNVFVNGTKRSSNNPNNICFNFADNTASKWVWAWGFGNTYEALGKPKQVHLVCSVEQDFRRKTVSPTLRVVDMIPIA